MTKNRILAVAASLFAALCSLPSQAQEVKVETLANDNFIIRIAPDNKEKYLILPIEEAAPESQV